MPPITHNQDAEGNVIVPFDDYMAMQARLDLLDALEAGGVDNWEWYGESTKHIFDDEDE